jgi:hypothetical protein
MVQLPSSLRPINLSVKSKGQKPLLAPLRKLTANFHYLSQYLFRSDKLPWYMLKYKLY